MTMTTALSHLPQQRLSISSLVLPKELIVEILSWFPVKSLLLFRCVSKTWNSLIFNPIFINLHLERLPKNTHVSLTFEYIGNEFCVTKTNLAFCSIHDLFQNPSSTIDHGFQRLPRCCHNNYIVLGVCNGLVCFWNHNYNSGGGFKKYQVWFWNPAIRTMSKDSPSLSLHSSNYKIELTSPRDGSPKCGFGYDKGNDAYKVVVLLLDVKSQKMEVKVHCLGDICWRSILTCPAFPILKQVVGQFTCGNVNWLALRRSTLDYQWETVAMNEVVIFSYDIENETYKYLLMPDGLVEVPYEEPCLGMLKGCLCLCYDQTRYHFVVWIMREFGVQESWTQLINVSYVKGAYFHFEPPYPMIPLCMSEDGNLLLAHNEHVKLLLYNQRDNIIHCADDFMYKIFNFSHDYVPSLVLPY